MKISSMMKYCLSLLRPRRGLLISAAATFPRFGSSLYIPTNSPYFTPHSYVSRCALSINLDSGTSRSVSPLTSTMTTKMMKNGDKPNDILPDMSSDVPSSGNNISASALSTDVSSLRYEPKERMEDLEEMIRIKDADLTGLSKEIASAAKELVRILSKSLSSSDDVEVVELPDMRERRDILAAEVDKLKEEYYQLKNMYTQGINK